MTPSANLFPFISSQPPLFSHPILCSSFSQSHGSLKDKHPDPLHPPPPPLCLPLFLPLIPAPPTQLVTVSYLQRILSTHSSTSAVRTSSRRAGRGGKTEHEISLRKGESWVMWKSRRPGEKACLESAVFDSRHLTETESHCIRTVHCQLQLCLSLTAQKVRDGVIS